MNALRVKGREGIGSRDISRAAVPRYLFLSGLHKRVKCYANPYGGY
jgi:hypothetical protein